MNEDTATPFLGSRKRPTLRLLFNEPFGSQRPRYPSSSLLCRTTQTRTKWEKLEKNQERKVLDNLTTVFQRTSFVD